MAAKDIVESAINDHKVTVFSKSYCPYCKRAKALLTEQVGDKGLNVIELDLRDDGPQLQAYLLEKTSQRTVPNIFIAQQHVGGSDDLSTAQRNGQLAKLLAA